MQVKVCHPGRDFIQGYVGIYAKPSLSSLKVFSASAALVHHVMQCPPTLHLHWVSTDPCAQGSMVFNGPHSRISRQASIVLVSPALLQKAQSSFATKMAFTEINWTLQTEIDACRPTLIFCTLEPIQILKAPSMKSSYTAAIIKMTFYIQGPKAILNHEPISERGTPSLWAE